MTSYHAIAISRAVYKTFPHKHTTCIQNNISVDHNDKLYGDHNHEISTITLRGKQKIVNPHNYISLCIVKHIQIDISI